MSRLITFLLSLVLLFGSQTMFVLGASIGSMAGLPEGYELVPAIMYGDVDGVPFNLTGTTDSVIAQLEKKHPNVDFAARAAARTAVLMNGSSAAGSSLAKKNQLPPICHPVGNWGWTYACHESVDRAMAEIRHISATWFMRPRTCSVITCIIKGEGSAEIVLCNDRQDNIRVGSEYLATYPQQTCNKCYFSHAHKKDCATYCGGQQFDTDNHNVITRGSVRCDRVPSWTPGRLLV